MLRGAMSEQTNGYYPPDAGHESRIIRLENLALENASTLSQQSANIDAMGKQLSLSIDNVAGKVGILTTEISGLSNKVQSLDSKIDNSNNRIAVLETDKKGFDWFRRFIRKNLNTLIAAIATGVGTYLIQHFLK